MNRTELRMAMRTLPFLDAHANAPGRMVELAAEPAPKLLVWEPAIVEWLFRNDAELTHPGSRSMLPLFGEHSLLWADGPRHDAYRRTLGPPIRGKRLSGYHGLLTDIVTEEVDALWPGQVVALSDWTRRLALRIIGRIVVGPGADAVLAALSAWLDRALGSRGRTLAYRFLAGGLPRSGAALDAALLAAAKHDTGGGTDGGGTLASLLRSGDDPLGEIDDEELRDQLVSLLFAGHETTAAATAWTLYRLDRDRQLRHDVLDELDTVTDAVPEPARAPLLQSVVQEALRLAPPVTVAENRKLPEAAEIAGHAFAGGTVFTTSIYLAHRQPEFFRDPLRFDGYRFLGERVPPQHYLPFGGGTRHCLGNQLGQLETRMIVAAVLRKRRWRCVNPRAGVLRLRGHAMAPDPRLKMVVRA